MTKTLTVKALKEFIIKKTELFLSEAMKSTMFGVVPSIEELDIALDGHGFDMNLQGQDSLAFDYSMLVAGLDGNTSNAIELHKVLSALVNTPQTDELPETVDDEEIENPNSQLNQILNQWDKRYGDHDIVDAARSIASGVMSSLGVEWV